MDLDGLNSDILKGTIPRGIRKYTGSMPMRFSLLAG